MNNINTQSIGLQSNYIGNVLYNVCNVKQNVIPNFFANLGKLKISLSSMSNLHFLSCYLLIGGKFGKHFEYGYISKI